MITIGQVTPPLCAPGTPASAAQINPIGAVASVADLGCAGNQADIARRP
jgi:hypothetical protein